jgi:A118 family predicted phage portal protein
MNEHVIKYLKEEGYENVSTSYYGFVQIWEDWYKNSLESFHKYHDTTGEERTMYTLGMAKRVCEDWASVLYGERDDITTSKKANEKYLKELKKDLNLDVNIPKCIEIASWSGTCGAVIRVRNAKTIDGLLVADKNTTRELIKVGAKQIIPLKVEHGDIVDVAFVSSNNKSDKIQYYIELHQLTETEGYKISNIYIDAESGKVIKNDAVLDSFKTRSNQPLFSILTPPGNNPIENNNGLGFSVYGNAIDQLKLCDITYHNFVMDFFLGGKKVFYNKKLTKFGTATRLINDEKVTVEVPIYPDDITKQQFMEVGDEISGDMDSKNLIHEYNPELRVDEGIKGIQMALDLTAFKTNLGIKKYQFEGGKVITATEYVGNQQDLIENAKKYRDNLSKFVTNIIKAGLLIGRMVFQEKVSENCDVLIDNVDGFMVDEESLKQSAREDLALGIISKLEYRMTVFNETEEVAQAMLDKLDKENKINNVAVV